MAESVTVHVSEMWLFNEKWELPLEVDTMTVTLRARTFLYPTLLSGSPSTFLRNHNCLFFKARLASGLTNHILMFFRLFQNCSL